MNLAGAMLITQSQTIWLQEGWLSNIDGERHEASGYFYYFTSRKLEINNKSELYINGVRLHIKIVMKSVVFHPNILKYQFIAVSSVGNLQIKNKNEIKSLRKHKVSKTEKLTIFHS